MDTETRKLVLSCTVIVLLAAVSVPEARAEDTKLSVKITNGGADTGNKAWFGVYPPSERQSYLGYGYSGEEVTVPEGTYDIGIHYEEGDAKSEKWLPGEDLKGSVTKTVEMGFEIARVKITITNGGLDVGSKGWFGLYKPSSHGSYQGWAYSGNEVVQSAGTWDIGVFFEEGSAKKEVWLNGLTLKGAFEKTVDIGLPIANVKLKILNGGADVGGKAWFGIYEPGERKSYLGWAHSGNYLTIDEGTYDVGIFFEDGAIKKEKWIPALQAKGTVEKSVDLAITPADIVVHVTHAKKPLPEAWCGIYPQGDHRGYVAWGSSDKHVIVEEGTYDIGCFYSGEGFNAEKWMQGEALKGKREIEVVLDFLPASLTVTPSVETGNAGSALAEGRGKANVELILDCSGSMAAQTAEKKSRMEIARSVYEEVVKELPEGKANVALRVYGTAPKAKKDCKDSTLLVPLGPADEKALLSGIAKLEPSGYTPIAYSLDQAAKDLPRGGNNSIVLVTDGIESCEGDPCAVSARLSQEGLLTRSFVVGFGLANDKGRILDCIGKYYSADNRADLKKALQEALQSSISSASGSVAVFKPGDRKEVVARGALGEKISFPGGSYDVIIRAGAQEFVWPAVKIEGDVKAAAGPVAPQ